MTLSEFIADNPELADLEILVMNPLGYYEPFDDSNFFIDVVEDEAVLIISNDD